MKRTSRTWCIGSPDAVAEEVREEGRDVATPEGNPSVAEEAREGTPAETENDRQRNSPLLCTSRCCPYWLRCCS